MEKRAPRLQFTDEERDDPVLKKPIRREQNAAAKADRAREKIPKKTVKIRARVVGPTTGKVTTRLKFEEIEKKKPPSKLTHAVRDAPANTVLSRFHREIRQSKDDNVGVEAAHKSEETAGLSARAGRSAYRSQKLKPYRKSVKAEQRLYRANLGYLQKKVVRDDPPALRQFAFTLAAEAGCQKAVRRREADRSVHGFCRKHYKNGKNGGTGEQTGGGVCRAAQQRLLPQEKRSLFSWH